MDEVSVFWLHKKVLKQRTKQKLNKKKTKKDCCVKVSSLSRGSIGIGVVLNWLSVGIVLHIDVIRAGLNKKAGGSSKVKFD